MNRPTIRSVATSLTCYVVDSSRIASMTCRGCRSPVDVHQPDQAQPDHYLATCSVCGLWSRLLGTTDPDKLVVLELPDVAEVLAACLDPSV